MSSSIHTMVMGTPILRRLGATASTLYLFALGLGLALTSSRQAVFQISGLLLSGIAGALLWRCRRPALGVLSGPDTEACWHALMAGSPDSILTIAPRRDFRGRIQAWEVRDANARAQELFAKDGLSLRGRPLCEVLPDGIQHVLAGMIETAMIGGVPQCEEQALHDAEAGVGEAPRWLHHQLIACDKGMLLITRDTTATHATALRHASERLRHAARVLEEMGDAVVVTDALDRIEFVNPAFVRMTGVAPSEIKGRSAELMGLAPLRDTHLSGVSDALRDGERWSGESGLLCAAGQTVDTWLSVSTLRDEKGKVTQHIRLFSDISSLKAQQQELVEQARHDSLTGLPNRRAFGERLFQAMARARRNPQTLAVLFVDLDGFKAVNDQLGHAAGDRVLVEVAQRLQDCVRLTDTVCRLAGDEFTVVLEGAGHAGELRRVCQRILDRLSLPYELGTLTLPVTPSIGAAVYEEGETQEQLCERADAAMYTAKRAGKARFVLSIPERAESVLAVAACQGAA